ncbi:MAG: hypothetical protein OXR66_07940 [Candidatus Woesearchaeota archaeon]|nr:hypothetical protein [Candidatus Woesearchaeota archaeon]
MLTDNLAMLGFSPSETKVYSHLIEHGCSYANKISARTGLNRTNVYEALDRLLTKGVISFITKNRMKWFEAKPPDVLCSLAKAKEEEFQHVRESLADEIALLPQSEPVLDATIFTGKKGLRMLFEDMLLVGKPIDIIAAELQFKEFFGPYFELWHEQRIKRKIPQRSIFPKSFEKKMEMRDFLTYKFVDDRFTNPTTTILYDENCLFIQWSKEPLAVKIHNKEITNSHRNYFNMLWN